MVRPIRRTSRWSGALTILLVAGCQSYEARPLDPADILETVERDRRVDAHDGGVTAV